LRLGPIAELTSSQYDTDQLIVEKLPARGYSGKLLIVPERFAL